MPLTPTRVRSGIITIARRWCRLAGRGQNVPDQENNRWGMAEVMAEKSPIPERPILDYGRRSTPRKQFSLLRIAIGVGIAVLLIVLYVLAFMVTDSYWFRHLTGRV